MKDFCLFLPGFFYSKQLYEENTFKFEDIFEPGAKFLLENSSQLVLKKLDTIYYGRCYTFCNWERQDAKQYFTLPLKRNFDIKLSIHMVLQNRKKTLYKKF